jgi:hypothetical protein
VHLMRQKGSEGEGNTWKERSGKGGRGKIAIWSPSDTACPAAGVTPLGNI